MPKVRHNTSYYTQGVKSMLEQVQEKDSENAYIFKSKYQMSLEGRRESNINFGDVTNVKSSDNGINGGFLGRHGTYEASSRRVPLKT